MAKRRGKNHQDRFIVLRGSLYQYRRRVPTELLPLDKRSPEVRISLKTADLAKARALRDRYEQADNELWASLLAEEGDDPWAKLEVAQRLVRAMGFDYRPLHKLAEGPLEDIMQRIEVFGPDASKPVVSAVLGAVDQPTVTIRKAFDIYVEKIAPHEIAGKSATQKHRWKNSKLRSVLHFIEVIGNLDIQAITRADARKYYDFWMGRIAPKEGAPTHSPDIGNRRLGDIAGLYEAYFEHLGEGDRPNPFDKLRFKRKSMKRRKRPPFSHKWITDKLLAPGALASMNASARAIFLVAANTGARLSEVANLVPERIVLDHDVPHIKIEPDEDPEDPREIKTETSIRAIPLVGMALDAMKKFPNGFDRYRDKGNSLSAAVNKYLKENKLLETDRHSFYSLRHSFEDRMKEAKVDSELRRILMGHSIDRPDYGEGGSLKLRQEAMETVALPYDPSIV